MNNCLQCGKETTNQKYCSYNCYNLNRIKIFKTNKCLRCGKEIETSSKKNQKYCSHFCHSKSRIKIWPINKCLKCDKEISHYNKFCSYSCNKSYYNSILPPWNKGLSKETDERVKKMSEKGANSRRGLEPWNKDLTEESDERVKNMSDKMRLHCKGWIHMKGKPSFFKGKKRPNISGEKNGMFGRVTHPKALFDNFLGHIIRSGWEKNFCYCLKDNNVNYLYEPETFKMIIDGKVCTYTPDLKIDDLYIEIKGYLTNKTIPKLKEFAKDHNFIIISGERIYKRLNMEGFICILYNEILSGKLSINYIINKRYTNVTH